VNWLVLLRSGLINKALKSRPDDGRFAAYCDRQAVSGPSLAGLSGRKIRPRASHTELLC